MSLNHVKYIYMDADSAGSPEVLEICARIDRPVHIIENIRAFYDWINQASDPIARGKEVLLLTRNKGAFIRKCPGTRNYICCGYKILHIGTFCTMDCSYCILQSYFHPPLLQFFVNHGDMKKELEALFSQKQIVRVGTGEFTDSLIWEWSGLSKSLVTEFAKQNHAVLELKSKTTAINNLKDLSHNKKTIIAWSLNTRKIVRSQELRSASLSARLKAAATCQSWGYPLAFHFDPMVIYPGCEKDYMEVIDELFSKIDPENIVWISLGTFRFMPDLKPLIRKRFGDSKIVFGEFIKGLDGKMRYFKPLRIELYKKVVSRIKQKAPDVRIYYCMEDEKVWKKTMGFVPSELGGLPQMLDESAARVCNLKA